MPWAIALSKWWIAAVVFIIHLLMKNDLLTTFISMRTVLDSEDKYNT